MKINMKKFRYFFDYFDSGRPAGIFADRDSTLQYVFSIQQKHVIKISFVSSDCR